MMHTIHTLLWALLLLCHTAFLIRSRMLLSRNEGPRRADRLLMGGSQLLLVPAVLTTIPLMRELPPVHILCCFMPPVMMFVLARKSFRRRHPMMLPLANGLWIAGAVLTDPLLTGGSL